MRKTTRTYGRLSAIAAVAASFAAVCTVSAAQPAATALVTVDVGREIGTIKAMNAVNNGPSVKKPNHVRLSPRDSGAGS